MATASDTYEAEDKARSMMHEYLQAGGSVNKDNSGNFTVTYGDGANLLDHIKTMQEQIANLATKCEASEEKYTALYKASEINHADLAVKYITSEQNHADFVAEFKTSEKNHATKHEASEKNYAYLAAKYKVSQEYYADLVAKYEASEGSNAAKHEASEKSYTKLKDNFNRLATFANVSRAIRLRHLHTFARDHSDLCEKYGLNPSKEAIRAGNIAAHEGDVIVDMELIIADDFAEDRLFELNYGIKASVILAYKNNENLIALVNSRRSKYNQLPKIFHEQYDELCERLSTGQNFQSLLFTCCGASFEIELYNGGAIAWAEVVEDNRNRIVQAASFLKNLSQ